MSPRVRLVPGVMIRVYEVLFVVVTQCFHCGFHLQMVHDRHIRVAERHERVRDRNDWRSICHFCFRGCVYHYSTSAHKKSGVSFRHEPADVHATGRLLLICCNTSTRWYPRHGSMHVRVNDGHFPNDCVMGRFERDKIVMSAHTDIFVWMAISFFLKTLCIAHREHCIWGGVRHQKHLTIWHQVYHQSTSDISTPSSSSTQCSELNPAACECSSSSSDQFQKSTEDSDEGECSCCCYVDCVADGDSESSVCGDYIDHVSSRPYDIGRASTGKASARRRFEDGRSEHDGGWSCDIWNWGWGFWRVFRRHRRRWRIAGPSCWQHGQRGGDEGQVDITRSICRVWSVRDREFARGSREEASGGTLGSGPQNGRNQNTIRHKRIHWWRDNVRCVRSKLDSEHGTRLRRLEFQEVVSHIHNRRDQPVFPRGRGRKNSRPHWRIRSLCFGDCENSCMARDALENAG